MEWLGLRTHERGETGSVTRIDENTGAVEKRVDLLYATQPTSKNQGGGALGTIHGGIEGINAQLRTRNDRL